MASRKLFLNELTENTRSYKVEVKVVEKGRPQTSPQKKITYQTVVLEDDKGNRIKGALFGDQVDGYKDAFVYNGEYEITNAPIKPCDARYKIDPREVDFQMTFGRQTLIQPLTTSSQPPGPQYQALANIPKVVGHPDKFDVLGVVLFVEETARKITTIQDREFLVREIVVTDHSNDQPITISTWNDLAAADLDLLATWAEKFHIIGFTALKVSGHKGFSLATTMSTFIIHTPSDERAIALGTWVQNHQDILADRQARVMAVRDPSTNHVLTTLRDLRTKKVNTTLQEERYRLNVNIPEADLSKVNAYVGCSLCGKRTEVTIGDIFTCDHCLKKECVAAPKVTFNCEVDDGSGSLLITMFTEDTERLFRMHVSDIFHIKHSDDIEKFAYVKDLLREHRFIVEVGPKPAMLLNKVLQWTLRKVITELDSIEPPPGKISARVSLATDQVNKAAGKIHRPLGKDMGQHTELNTIHNGEGTDSYGHLNTSDVAAQLPTPAVETTAPTRQLQAPPTPILAVAATPILATPSAAPIPVQPIDNVEIPVNTPANSGLKSFQSGDQSIVLGVEKVNKVDAQTMRSFEKVQVPNVETPKASVLHPAKKMKLIVPKVEKHKGHTDQGQEAPNLN